MALHIQMSEEAEKEYKRTKMRGALSSFGAAFGLSLAFALTLTFTVIVFATDPPAELKFYNLYLLTYVLLIVYFLFCGILLVAQL